MFKIKTTYKLVLLFISIFILGLYIAKISIDRTFKKMQCNQEIKSDTNHILLKIKEV